MTLFEVLYLLFTYTRTDYENDTREEVLSILAKHFELE